MALIFFLLTSKSYFSYFFLLARLLLLLYVLGVMTIHRFVSMYHEFVVTFFPRFMYTLVRRLFIAARNICVSTLTSRA